MDYEALIVDGPEAGRVIGSYPIGAIRYLFKKYGKDGIRGDMAMLVTETCPITEGGCPKRYIYYPLFRNGKFVLSLKMSKVRSCISNSSRGDVDFWDGSELA
jgi:hypothetical protein